VAELLRQAWTIARKDLLLEFRSRTAIMSAAVFTALVLVVFNFGRDPTAVPTLTIAPSILWVTFTFAGMVALNRALSSSSRTWRWMACCSRRSAATVSSWGRWRRTSCSSRR